MASEQNMVNLQRKKYTRIREGANADRLLGLSTPRTIMWVTPEAWQTTWLWILVGVERSWASKLR